MCVCVCFQTFHIRTGQIHETSRGHDSKLAYVRSINGANCTTLMFSNETGFVTGVALGIEPI